MSAFSGKKLLLLGFIIVLLVIIPLTVFLVQQQQKTTTQAAQTSILSVTPPTESMAVGDEKEFQIKLNPVQNQISFVKVNITYDETKLETSTDRVVINSAAFQTPALAGPLVSSGNISFTVSVGSDPTRSIKSDTLVATVKFKALAPTAAGATTPITIVKGQSQALSIASSDQFNEDVLASTNPSKVTVTGSETGGSGASTNQVPVCSSLNIDREATGTAPYSVTFTVIGNDADGTISKVTMNYGDGPQEDITTGGGIGTNSVNLQKAHTYNNAGNFTATATLTDNSNGVSTVGTCTKTITVNSGTSGGGTGTIITVSPTPSATPSGEIIPTETPVPTSLPAVGPADTIIKVGGAILFTVLGIILLLAL